ncbi:hypothetical protein [Edwardsiella tarda]|uniref:Uncharacterized protein n=1 Tax=Edwardsiella tarda TaxID=636 RepID=A0A2A7U741_EDWTA|nr:hypothetical protein [Edwardsiella tarda]PEH74119.1 hypothetical protein CRM76_02120 [Edwardsiella tarda]
MTSKIIIVLLSIGLIYSGKCIISLTNDLADIKQEFSDYRQQVDQQIQSIKSLDSTRHQLQGDYNHYQRKAIKDTAPAREKLVRDKPGLAEKAVNDSFKELMASIGGEE